MTIRLLIADDHPWVREGLRCVFGVTDIEIVAEAATGQAAVRLALELEIDVVLLDINMPEGDGVEALTQIKAVKGDLPVLIHSAQDRLCFVQRCVDLGACGFLRKGVDKHSLIAAVRKACAEKDLRAPVNSVTKAES